MPLLTVRVDLDSGGRVGRGKIELLEHIASLGSISAAGRVMGMSYRRAWTLVEETNGMFGQEVATRQVGGKNGGGATSTSFGLTLVARFRAIEGAASEAARDHLEALQIGAMSDDTS